MRSVVVTGVSTGIGFAAAKLLLERGFRIFGSRGGLEWHQEHPNELRHRRRDGFEQVMTKRLHDALSPQAERATRVEIGHPEGLEMLRQ